MHRFVSAQNKTFFFFVSLTHVLMIDPWLTIKSSSCPLCKHDCSIDIIPRQEDVSITLPPPLYTRPLSIIEGGDDSVIELPCRRPKRSNNNTSS